MYLWTEAVNSQSSIIFTDVILSLFFNLEIKSLFPRDKGYIYRVVSRKSNQKKTIIFFLAMAG